LDDEIGAFDQLAEIAADSGQISDALRTMVAVWLIFTLMLFVAEPFILHRWLLAQSQVKPEATFRFVEWMPEFCCSSV
jgi:hypothetical protein